MKFLHRFQVIIIRILDRQIKQAINNERKRLLDKLSVSDHYLQRNSEFC